MYHYAQVVEDQHEICYGNDSQVIMGKSLCELAVNNTDVKEGNGMWKIDNFL